VRGNRIDSGCHIQQIYGMAGRSRRAEDISAGFRHRGRRSGVTSLVDGAIKWIEAA
jgi:hypothetical protein